MIFKNARVNIQSLDIQNTSCIKEYVLWGYNSKNKYEEGMLHDPMNDESIITYFVSEIEEKYACL